MFTASKPLNSRSGNQLEWGSRGTFAGQCCMNHAFPEPEQRDAQNVLEIPAFYGFRTSDPIRCAISVICERLRHTLSPGRGYEY